MRSFALTSAISIHHIPFKPTYHVHYDYQHNGPLIPKIDKLKNLHVNALFLTGDHGNFNSNPRTLNNIPERDVDKLVAHLKKEARAPIKSIVMDSCDSAYFISHFQPILDNNAVVYCNLSDGRQHNAIQIFSEYQHYKDLTLGMAFFNLITLMMANENGIEQDAYLSYPAIYTKAENTLYYYGEANPRIIASVKAKGIQVVHLKIKDDYLDRLLHSDMPLQENQDQLPRVYPAYRNELDKIKPVPQRKRSQHLSEKAVIDKMQILFKEMYRSPSELSAEQYTKRLFPIVSRLAPVGVDPIMLLAKSACQFCEENTNQKSVAVFYEAIAQVLQKKFTLQLLREHIDKDLQRFGNKLTAAQAQKLKTALNTLAIRILGKSLKSEAIRLVNLLLAEQPIPIRKQLKPKPSIQKQSFFKKYKNPIKYALSLGAILTIALLLSEFFIFTQLGVFAMLIPPIVSMGFFAFSAVIQLKSESFHVHQQAASKHLRKMHSNSLKHFLSGSKNPNLTATVDGFSGLSFEALAKKGRRQARATFIS